MDDGCSLRRDRCEKQLKFLEQHPEVDALSGTIAEFQGDALDGLEQGVGIPLDLDGVVPGMAFL